MKIFSIDEIKEIVKPIARRYGVQAIYLFSSYTRGTATEGSDLDFLVFGGEGFKYSLVYAMGEDLREAFKKILISLKCTKLMRIVIFIGKLWKKGNEWREVFG